MDVVSRCLGSLVGVKLQRTNISETSSQDAVSSWPPTEKSDTKYSPKNPMMALMKLFRSQRMGLRKLCRCPPALGPPRVRPGALNPALATGPAILIAFSTAWVSLGGLAPWMVSMGDPFLKIMKVGMARTPYCEATSRSLSTSILAKAMRLGLVYLVARDSKVGAIILQGPHQSA